MGHSGRLTHDSPLLEPPLARYLLMTFGIAFLLFFLVLPLVVVFYEAFADGIAVYARAVSDRYTLSAVRLTTPPATIRPAVPVRLP